jgi:hypothetical protein
MNECVRYKNHSISQSVYKLISQSTNQSTSAQINQSINKQINQSIVQLTYMYEDHEEWEQWTRWADDKPPPHHITSVRCPGDRVTKETSEDNSAIMQPMQADNTCVHSK